MTKKRAVMPVQLTKNVGLMSLSRMLDNLGKSDVDGLVLLVALARSASRIPGADLNLQGAMSPESLALLMAGTLCARPMNEPMERALTAQPAHAAIEELAHIAYGVNAEYALRGVPDRSELRMRTLAATLGTQIALQGDPGSAIARYAILTGTAEARGLGMPRASGEHDFGALLTKEFGLPVPALLAGVFCLWVLATREPVFRVEHALGKLPLREELIPAVEAVLRVHSLDVEDVKNVFLHELHDYPPFGRVHALFTRYPFIRLADDWFVAAPHHYARMAMANALLFLTREACAKHVPTNAKNPYDNGGMRQLGTHFEDYAFHLIKSAMPRAEAWSEHYYERKQTAYSPDGVFVEGAKEAVLMQAKLRLPNEGLSLGAPTVPFDREFFDSYGKLIAQSVKYLYRLEDLVARGRLRPEAKEPAMRVLAAKRWTLLGVVPLVPPVLHLPPFQKRLHEGVMSLLNDQETSWYCHHRAQGRIALTHVDSIQGIEVFAALGGVRSLPSTLRTWHAAKNRAWKRLGEDRTLPAPFGEYCKQLRKGRLAMPSWLKGAYQEAYREAYARYLVGEDPG